MELVLLVIVMVLDPPRCIIGCRLDVVVVVAVVDDEDDGWCDSVLSVVMELDCKIVVNTNIKK